MSNYTPKPNSGTLWPNQRKAAQNHPDMRGDVYLDRLLLQDLVDSCEGEFIHLSVAGWEKIIAGKNCVSLSFQRPYNKEEKSERQIAPRQAKPVVDDTDIPF